MCCARAEWTDVQRADGAGLGRWPGPSRVGHFEAQGPGCPGGLGAGAGRGPGQAGCECARAGWGLRSVLGRLEGKQGAGRAWPVGLGSDSVQLKKALRRSAGPLSLLGAHRLAVGTRMGMGPGRG